MRKIKPTSMISLILSAILLWTTACTPPSLLSQQTGPQTNVPIAPVSQTQRAYAQEMIEKIKNKKPNTGPISVKVNTGLLKQNPSGRVVDLSHKLNHTPTSVISTPLNDRTFKTQAVPAGPVVFQETFVRTQGQDTVQRTFTVTDPAKFYTLHVQNGDAQGNNQTTSAVINLNGFDWVRPNEIKKNIPEVQKDNVLLQATNTLTVAHHGSPGSTFTFTVVEGDHRETS